MTVLGNVLPWIVCVALAAALAAGVVLLLLGRGRRVGAEPHCRKCGYNLTGLMAARCPECGQPATGRDVVIGTRRYRWALLGPGIAVSLLGVLVGGALLFSVFAKVDPYVNAPVYLLEQQAKGDNRRAIAELARRIGSSAVPAQRLAYLIPLGLTHHGLRPHIDSAIAWARFLAEMESAGQMTTPQIRQFHDQAVSFDIDFRRRVRAGEPFEIICKTSTCGSANLKAGCIIGNCVVTIGDAIEQRLPYVGAVDFASGNSCPEARLRPPITGLAPGSWPVHLHASKVFTQPYFKYDIDLEYALEVIPADSHETIKLIRADELGQQLSKAISIKSAAKRLGQPPEPGIAYLDLRVSGPVPVDAAFVLLLRVGEREIEVTDFTCRRTSISGIVFAKQSSCPTAEPDGEAAIPVLRSSPEAARREPDMLEIWDGELVFPPIQLKVLAPATGSAPSPGP
jgi:hypothetical protein